MQHCRNCMAQWRLTATARCSWARRLLNLATIRLEFYAGYCVGETPRRFSLGERRIEVTDGLSTAGWHPTTAPSRSGAMAPESIASHTDLLRSMRGVRQTLHFRSLNRGLDVKPSGLCPCRVQGTFRGRAIPPHDGVRGAAPPMYTAQYTAHYTAQSSKFGAATEKARSSTPSSRQGHSTRSEAEPDHRVKLLCHRLLFGPPRLGAVGPDTVKADSQFTGHGALRPGADRSP